MSGGQPKKDLLNATLRIYLSDAIREMRAKIDPTEYNRIADASVMDYRLLNDGVSNADADEYAKLLGVRLFTEREAEVKAKTAKQV